MHRIDDCPAAVRLHAFAVRCCLAIVVVVAFIPCSTMAQFDNPPPPPIVWLEEGDSLARLRWNGTYPEGWYDAFLAMRDFEGYNVYLFFPDIDSAHSVIAEYDYDDYIKFVRTEQGAEWRILDPPFTIVHLRCLYGDGAGCNDTSFHPEDYSPSNPFVGFADSLFYFEPFGQNVSALGIETPITKIYPDQPWPSHINPDFANPDEVTDDGYLKYFEYELLLDPIMYEFVNDGCFGLSVTAYDFGWPPDGIPPSESDPTDSVKWARWIEPEAPEINCTMPLNEIAEVQWLASPCVVEYVVYRDGSLVDTVAGGRNDTISVHDICQCLPDCVVEYSVEAVNSKGMTSMSETFALGGTAVVRNVDQSLPVAPAMSCSFPNPFNASTTIQFDIPRGGHTTLRVFNALGQTVATLVDGHVAAGRKTTTWDGTDSQGKRVASGLYYYQLTTGSGTLTKKLVLLK